MPDRRFAAAFKRAYARYDRFMEKQGFGIVLVVCVLIILSSALYTFHFRQKWAEEDWQDEPGMEAGAQQAQTLLEAQALVQSQSAQQAIVPTEAPFTFAQPVEGFLDRDYSMQEPQYFAVPNYYRLHPGIDLQVAYGTPVKACAQGTVLRVWQDSELGLCVRIRHGHGYEAVYAGLSDASYVRQGDPVAQGQTIGHSGNGVLAESDAEPHLHLEPRHRQAPAPGGRRRERHPQRPRAASGRPHARRRHPRGEDLQGGRHPGLP